MFITLTPVWAVLMKIAVVRWERGVCVCVYQNGRLFLARPMISASGQVYQADDQRVDTCCPNNLFSGVGPGTTPL